MEEKQPESGGRTGIWGSSRWGLAAIAFLGFVNLYALRVNLSVALVCMVNFTAIADPDATNVSLASRFCGSGSLIASKSSGEEGEFVWEKSAQGLVLGAFFWGYLVTEIPGGVLSERFGGKHVFLWFMLVAAICTLLSPLAARVHFGLLIFMRVVIGLGEGVVFPAMHSLWSAWAPPMERSQLTGASYAGAQIGNVLTLPLAAYLCHAAGWPSVFYVFGSLGLVWCAAWFFMASNSPSEHRRISKEELAYITNSLKGQIDQDPNEKMPIPWMSFVKSGPVWAIIVGHTCANFGTYLVLTSLPTFMKEILNFDIKSNGLFSAIPYIAYFLAINAAGFLSDFLISRRILSTTRVRKLMMAFSLCGQSAFLVGTGYCGCGQELLAVALITIAQGISGFQYGGFVVNHVDIAPRFAGTLFGISNTFATISGILAPSIASALTTAQTRAAWRSVFWVSAGILVFGALFYCLFGSGELQPWAKSPTRDTEVKLLELERTPTQAEKPVSSDKEDD